MDQGRTRGADDRSRGAVRASLVEFRACVGTRSARWLVAATALVGMTVAVALAGAVQPADRTFAALAGPVLSLMSVTLPFVGVLATHNVRRPPEAARVVPTLLGAVLLAVAVGVFGTLVSAAALAVAPSDTPRRWDHAATIVVGGVLVQVVAQLVGTGLGLLVRPVVVACLATIVLPLGLWLLLDSIDLLRPAQGWLTPYAAAQHLLSGRMSALKWTQWFVVFVLWGAGLNTVGVACLRR